MLMRGNTDIAHGFMMQETDEVGDNAEDMDADLQRVVISLMHNMPNPSVFALSGESISMTSGEVPSVLMTWQAADALVSLQEPIKDIATPTL